MPGSRFFPKGAKDPEGHPSPAGARYGSAAEDNAQEPRTDAEAPAGSPFLLVAPRRPGGRRRWRLGRMRRRPGEGGPAVPADSGPDQRWRPVANNASPALTGPGSDGDGQGALRPATAGGKGPAPAGASGVDRARERMEAEAEAGAAPVPRWQSDPGPFGWFLYVLLYVFTAVYSAQPNPEAGVFGADVAGGTRMAVWLTVLPALVAGIYAGLTACGRSWWYAATLVLVPLVLERLALYLYGMAGQWMTGGFPDGWRQALALRPALAFTRETLAPYASVAYFLAAPVSLLVVVVGYGVTVRLSRRWRWSAGRV